MRSSPRIAATAYQAPERRGAPRSGRDVRIERQALLLSLEVASFAVLLTVPFALAFAWALARGRFIGRPLLEALVNLPLVLPPVVTGYALRHLRARGAARPLAARHARAPVRVHVPGYLPRR